MTRPKTPRVRWMIGVVAVVLFAVPGIFVAWPAYQRHKAIQQIERMGGMIESVTVGQKWLWRIGHVQTQVVEINLVNTDLRNDQLQLLNHFRHLETVKLGGTQVDDDGLIHLSRLPDLCELELNSTQVSNSGLKHLRSLPRLVILDLENTRVDDAGLKYLRGMSNLRRLWLFDTEVTEEGIKTLHTSLPNCDISN